MIHESAQSDAYSEAVVWGNQGHLRHSTNTEGANNKQSADTFFFFFFVYLHRMTLTEWSSLIFFQRNGARLHCDPYSVICILSQLPMTACSFLARNRLERNQRSNLEKGKHRPAKPKVGTCEMSCSYSSIGGDKLSFLACYYGSIFIWDWFFNRGLWKLLLTDSHST